MSIQEENLYIFWDFGAFNALLFNTTFPKTWLVVAKTVNRPAFLFTVAFYPFCLLNFNRVVSTRLLANTWLMIQNDVINMIQWLQSKYYLDHKPSLVTLISVIASVVTWLGFLILLIIRYRYVKMAAGYDGFNQGINYDGWSNDHK